MSTPNKICKDGAAKSKLSNDDVCEMNMLRQLSMADNVEENVSVCANCGKDNASNICNKCKMVMYCNAACKKKHRHKHKKQCERRVAELHDIELFKEPPPKDDCPICFLRLPYLGTGQIFMACCGKLICSGCVYAPLYDNKGNEVDNKKCPFCRVVAPKSEEETIKREKIRVDMNDPIAIYKQGCYYQVGANGYPQDYTKALELWHRAAELGHATTYNNIGVSYENGIGVEVDEKKAKHHYELAAVGGDEVARNNLGRNEVRSGNMERALKHFIIAVRIGDSPSLDLIKQLYTNGHATKDDYTKALRSYQTYLDEIKSDHRDRAAAFSDEYKYY